MTIWFVFCRANTQVQNSWIIMLVSGFSDSSGGKESTCSAGDMGVAGLILGSVRSPGGVNGDPLQYSCLENSMDRGAWWAAVHVVTKNQAKHMAQCKLDIQDFKKLPNCFPNHFTFPLVVYKGSSCSTSLLTLGMLV